MDYRFDARVNYQYSMSLFTQEDERSNEEKISHIYNHLKKNFSCLADWEEEAKTDPIFSEIATVQNFLHGGGLPFACSRFLIRGLWLRFDDLPAEESAVMRAEKRRPSQSSSTASFGWRRRTSLA